MGAGLIHNIDPQRQGEILSHAALLAAENRLVPHIPKVIGLEGLPAAHADLANGHTIGKVVVKMADCLNPNCRMIMTKMFPCLRLSIWALP